MSYFNETNSKQQWKSIKSNIKRMKDKKEIVKKCEIRHEGREGERESEHKKKKERNWRVISK